MDRQIDTPFHAFFRKIASTPAGAWLFARTATRIDRIFLKVSHSKLTLANLLTGIPVMVLTTTGARSGLPRKLTVLYLKDPEQPGVLAIIASNFGQQHNPGWYYNLQANPRATAAIDGKVRKYLTHEAAEEEYVRLWLIASQTFEGFKLYRQLAGERHIPIMVLTPEQD